MNLTPRDIFVNYLIDDPMDMESYFNDTISFIHGECQRKGHEFDGYFQSRWNDAADTITQFNVNYFDDKNRKKLYVYLSAMIDDEIFHFLNDAQEVAGYKSLSKEDIQNEIENLIKLGVKF